MKKTGTLIGKFKLTPKEDQSALFVRLTRIDKLVGTEPKKWELELFFFFFL